MAEGEMPDPKGSYSATVEPRSAGMEVWFGSARRLTTWRSSVLASTDGRGSRTTHWAGTSVIGSRSANFRAIAGTRRTQGFRDDRAHFLCAAVTPNSRPLSRR